MSRSLFDLNLHSIDFWLGEYANFRTTSAKIPLFNIHQDVLRDEFWLSLAQACTPWRDVAFVDGGPAVFYSLFGRYGGGSEGTWREPRTGDLSAENCFNSLQVVS